jgi:hypothetical protein
VQTTLYKCHVSVKLCWDVRLVIQFDSRYVYLLLSTTPVLDRHVCHG